MYKSQSHEPAVFFFISVGRKEKYGWLVRLASHKENGLVNQVNLLGVAHTFTTNLATIKTFFTTPTQ